MKKESLEKALNQCIEAIEKADITLIDKVELMINIKQFLESENYERNIKILRREYER